MLEKTRKALLKANTGRIISDDTRNKMKISAKKRYDTGGVEYPNLINIWMRRRKCLTRWINSYKFSGEHKEVLH